MAVLSDLSARIIKVLFGTRLKIALTAVLLIFLALNGLWEAAGHNVLRHDALLHAQRSLDCFYPVAASVPTPPHPRSVHLLAWVLLKIFGYTPWPFFIAEAFFLVLTACAVYCCGRELMSEREGFWAACFLVFSTQCLMWLRSFYLDYPLAACFMWQLYFYLRSRRMSWRNYAMAFAAMFPIGGFIKYPYFIYGFFLVIGVLFDMRKELRGEWKSLWLIAGTGAGIFMVISLVLNIIYGALAGLAAVWLITSDRKKCGKSFSVALKQTAFRLAHYISAAMTFFLVIYLIFMPPFDYAGYARMNIARPHHELAYTFTQYLELLSFWLQGWLIELKACVLQPDLFWCYIVGLLMIAFSRRDRRRLAVVVIPMILASIFFAAATYNVPRYHAPILGLRCLVMAFALSKIGIAAWAVWLFSLSVGLSCHGGWLTSLPLDRVTPYLIHYELKANKLSFERIYLPEAYRSVSAYEKIFFDKNGHLLLNKANRLGNIFNSRSGWSDDLYFTVEPYADNWNEAAKNLGEIIPNESQVHIVSDAWNLDKYYNGTDTVETERFFYTIVRGVTGRTIDFRVNNAYKATYTLYLLQKDTQWPKGEPLYKFESGIVKIALYKGNRQEL